MSNNEEFLLKWNNHQSNLIGVFKDWLQDESFVDVTLVCGGEAVSGHKVVLAACSPLLNRILHDNPCRHPVVILNDVCSTDMKALLKFIYQGEVSVSQNELASFLKTADNLQIKGLAEGRDEEKKRKDDAVGCGIRKKRKTEARLGTSIQQSPQTQRKKEEYISTSPNCQSQNTCLLNSSTNEVSSGTTFSNSLNPQVENSKLTNSNLQSDSSNSSVSLPKESMLIVKTEPLDYAGEMVWQESNSNLLLKPEVVGVNKSSASNSSCSSNNSININANNCNSAQNPEMHSATLPFVVLQSSLENIDSASTADILQKNLELVLSGEEKRPEDEIKNVSFGSEDLNQATLNAGQNVSRGALGGVDGANGGGFKDLVEDSPDFTVKEENDDQYYSDENPPQSFNASDSENLTCKRGLQMISKNSFNSGSESYSVVTPFTPSSSGSYYIRNGALLCCKSCPYQSINPYTFNRHLRIHVGNKEFKCDHCDYATTRKDSLIRHSRVKH
ncbi:UNVERIFIED_CONTAM: hypothetical protein RMT77_007204 [Armadillidium vulgare]